MHFFSLMDSHLLDELLLLEEFLLLDELLP